MICPRFMMLRCSRSRRRSRKRYFSRVSSGYSWSPNTGSGNSAAGAEDLDFGDEDFDVAGRKVLVLGAGRPAATLPSIRTTHSERSVSTC